MIFSLFHCRIQHEKTAASTVNSETLDKSKSCQLFLGLNIICVIGFWRLASAFPGAVQ